MEMGALLLSVPLILFLAVFLGGLKPEIHFPEWLPEFILANLFLCLWQRNHYLEGIFNHGYQK